MNVLLMIGVFFFVISLLLILITIAIWLYVSFGKSDAADAQLRRNMADYRRSYLK